MYRYITMNIIYCSIYCKIRQLQSFICMYVLYVYMYVYVCTVSNVYKIYKIVIKSLEKYCTQSKNINKTI